MPAPLIKRLVDLHRAQVFGIVDVRGVGRLRKIYADSRSELEDKLRWLVRSGRGETFGAQHLRLVLAQVTDAVRGFEAGMERHLVETGRTAMEFAPRSIVRMIGEMEAKFGRMTPVVQAQQAAVLKGVYREISPSLLDKYRSSTRLYGPPAIRSIREHLARSIVQGESVDDAVDRVSGTHGLFAGQRWRAERIVRTELAYTTGFATQKSIEQLRPSTPRLMKRLVATHDARTGEDSEQLDGQTVPVDQPFVWVVKNSRGEPTGKIVRYMFPPNRPHDREVNIPWQADWGASAIADSGAVTPRSPSS